MISTKGCFPDSPFSFVKTLLFVTFVALAFTQCVDKRKSPDSSAIGITVCYKSGKQCRELDWIYFVKIDNANNDPFYQDDYILSNYSIRPAANSKRDVILLNAKPGKYAAIGGTSEVDISFPGEKKKIRKRIYFFPEQMITLTVTDLKPAQFAYMGSYIIDDTGEPRLSDLYKIKNADKAQMHYCRMMRPDRAKPSKKSCLFEIFGSFFDTMIDADEENETVYAAKIINSDKNREEEINFLKRSHHVLSRTEWLPLIEKAME